MQTQTSKTEVVQTDDAPKAVGPYTQGRTIAGGSKLLFTAGQIGLDPSTSKLVSEDVVEQAEQAIKNLEAVLVSGKSSLNNVLKATLFLVDMGDFAKVNELYAKKFKEPFPARSTVAVKQLPLGAKFEIEAIAFVDESL
mmetsp:Transcript_5582/g.6032  ORF Transcript_5582/g.6032 Transcript_5582/m.6032 type:complete len:139 (+) Transcript_5582:22-438(+)|eukprot:CAMPEP_0176428866 /NCGR_PEP_ID=MMETSP0127-20121128/13389_1 /TAXON_ID=938130 /ORGANISM="Platyophrya macrostoma, Strain WH" /LENGTH=138 /DNA_ID=CAMNT_0017810599 /DNA_START=28 /DNA_END=444 /DNA_ORIENTATION=-